MHLFLTSSAILIFSFLFLPSCKDPKPKVSTVDALEKEVIAIHDEAMPNNAKLISLARELKDLSERARMDSVAYKKVWHTIRELEDAEEGMMQWMADYKVPANADEAAILQYLTTEKEKISKVKMAMDSALVHGTNLLNSFAAPDSTN